MLGIALLRPIVLLLFLMVPAVAKPIVFWFNDPVGPDQTILVTGADLDAVTAATVTRAPEAGMSPTPELAATLLQINAQSLKIVLPAELAPGIFRVKLHHADGNETIDVNLPTIYWSQGDLGDAATPGGWIQIFGRNILRRPERAQLLLVSDDTGAELTAPLIQGDIWRARFDTPKQIKPGDYRLRLSNGDGAFDQRVDAGRIQIRTNPPAPAPTFTVTDYGATGDGKKDSTAAIRTTIDAAKAAGGGIVFIPRGRYMMSEELSIPPGVSLRGERADLVNLFWPDMCNPPGSLIRGTSHFAIEDLTIYASNHRHIISGGFMGGDFEAPGARDISIRRVRIRASAYRGLMNAEETFRRMTEQRPTLSDSPPATIRLSGKHLEVVDCDIVGSGMSLRLFKATDAVVSRNLLANGRGGYYSILGSRHVIFEDNVVSAADLQATGGAFGTLSRWVSSSEDIFFGGNTVRGIYGEDREGVTTDGPGGYYFGRAESTAADRLSLTDEWKAAPVSPFWSGAVVMVINGRGAGQFARIREPANQAESPPRTLLIDRPLAVPLDSSSVVTITQAQQNYLIVGNSFEDTGVAAQSFGTAINHVIAGNRATRSSGFYAIGLAYGHFQPSWHVQLLDNRIIEGNVYRAGPPRPALSEEAAVGVHAYQVETKRGAPPLARAIVIRGNRLEQDAHIELRGFSGASPGIRDVIVEDNYIGPSRQLLQVDAGVASLLTRRNEMTQRISR
jgi:hypothetical protein